jgi:hypothetical protein
MTLRKTLFWDTDPKTIDLDKNGRYVIERVLDLGEPDEVRWLFKRYSKDQIKDVIGLPRVQLSPKSKALWSLVLP